MPRRLASCFIACAFTLPLPLCADPTTEALNVGLEALEKGEVQSALTTFLNAYNERASAHTEKDPICMMLLAHGGKLLYNSGQFVPAAACFERLHGIAAILHGPGHPQTIITGVHLAHYLGRAGQKLDTARRLCQEAMVACALQPEIPRVVHLRALYTYADILLAQKERIAAASAFRDYLKHTEALARPPHIEMSEVYLKLSAIDTFFGRAKDAEIHRKKALEHLRQGRGDTAPEVFSMRLAAADQMTAADATGVLESVLKDLAGVAGVENEPKLQQVWSAAEFRLAVREAEQNKRDGLLTRLKSAIAHGIKGYGEDHEQLLPLYLELAKLHLSMRQNKEGVECYRRVLAIRTKALGPNHESVVTTQKILDDLLADLRKSGEDV